jgi:hypothetical protein
MPSPARNHNPPASSQPAKTSYPARQAQENNDVKEYIFNLLNRKPFGRTKRLSTIYPDRGGRIKHKSKKRRKSTKSKRKSKRKSRKHY